MRFKRRKGIGKWSWTLTSKRRHANALAVVPNGFVDISKPSAWLHIIDHMCKFVVRSPYFSVFWKARIRHATSLPIIKALTERLAGMETTGFAQWIPCAIFTATADQQDACGSFN
ncbi:hypothetical protein X797_007567 [Metarhizium robertsii]|uniref:Uncharacterized protein n=1 Tax=Metarhizium robertsii TaxID=568076 RepID=A0A014P868_9HYPO|nr:hypothetical protein X797_007567 [Metarhizium robertsii]